MATNYAKIGTTAKNGRLGLLNLKLCLAPQSIMVLKDEFGHVCVSSDIAATDRCHTCAGLPELLEFSAFSVLPSGEVSVELLHLFLKRDGKELKVRSAAFSLLVGQHCIGEVPPPFHRNKYSEGMARATGGDAALVKSFENRPPPDNGMPDGLPWSLTPAVGVANVEMVKTSSNSCQVTRRIAKKKKYRSIRNVKCAFF